ncbi:hypothetical protein [Aeromicrobium sp.]|uniref:hypothetical protein n=1 Tax=Aeromicrobium sp. TaxID=1871063 RepID=UPI001994F27B|nr:hypothetical protein [Aeromicrobium sp.]MBC7633831.1 hypothetical protein [Aeromicrobium sp.]
MDSSQGDGGTDDRWCADMFAWMRDQSSGSMMSSMMWQGPEQMRISCREWVNQDGANAGASAQQRCSAMVDWMSSHMSTRGGNWMMQGR